MKKNRYKISSMLLLFALFTTLLTSCANTAASNATSTTATKADALAFIDPNTQGDGCDSTTGYYRVIPREDGSSNFYFVDYANKLQTILCSRPECLHNNNTCPAWISFGGGGAIPVVTKDKIVIVSLGNTDQDIIEAYGDNALPRIETIDLNGSNRKILYTCKASSLIQKEIAYSNSFIYFVVNTFENIAESGGLPTRSLFSCNLQTGAVEEVIPLEISESIVGAFDDCLVFGNSAGAETITTPAEEITTNISVFSLETRTQKQILSHSFTVQGRMDGSAYYMYDPAADIVSLVDLKSGTKPVTLNASLFDQSMDSAILQVGSVWDDRLFITQEIISEEFLTVTLQSYAINLRNGKLNECDLQFTIQTDSEKIPKAVEIVAETGDYFMVLSSVNFIDVTISIAGEPTTLENPVMGYSLIKKTDYFNSIPNYIEIEEI